MAEKFFLNKEFIKALVTRLQMQCRDLDICNM